MFSQVEKLWLQKCIETQLNALARSANKEIPGSEIRTLRDLEMQQLQDLRTKCRSIEVPKGK